MLRPVSRASASRSSRVAARCSRWRTCVTPARESTAVCDAPIPSMMSIFTANPLSSNATCAATIRARREPCWGTPLRAPAAGDSILPLPRSCCESIIGPPLRARRPRGAARAACEHGGGGSSRGHVRRPCDRERRLGGPADQCHAAVLAAVPGHPGRPDGVPQGHGRCGQQRRRRPRDGAAAHRRRRSHLDAHAAAGRALLERRVRRSARRALHVRAPLQGPRAAGGVALRRDRRRRGLPAEPCHLHARSRHRAERPRDHVPPHAPGHGWLQKLALPPAALLPPSVGTREIGTDVARLVGTGPYRWASYAPSRQLVLRRNPHFEVWAPAAQPDGHVDHIVERFGLGIEAEVTQVERGQADWVVDDLPADRISEVLGRYAPQAHVNPLPADWYVALNVNIKPFKDIKAGSGQPRDRPRQGDQALRRAAAGGADVPDPAAGLPRLCPLLPLDAERHCAVGRAGLRARAAARRGVGHGGDPGRHRGHERRRAEGHRQVHSGRALQARIRPARERAAGRRPAPVRAELAPRRRGQSRAVAAGVPGALGAARRDARLRFVRAGLRHELRTSAVSATAKRCSR